MVIVKGLAGTDFSFCYIKRDSHFIRMVENFDSITFMERVARKWKWRLIYSEMSAAFEIRHPQGKFEQFHEAWFATSW